MDSASQVRESQAHSEGPDDGLRRVMVWVLVTLVFAVTAAAFIAHLAIRWFDVP